MLAIVVGKDRPIKQSINQSHNTIFCAGKRRWAWLARNRLRDRLTYCLAWSVRLTLAQGSQPVHPGPACQAEPATSFTQFQLFFVFGARSAIRVWGAALSVSDLVRSSRVRRCFVLAASAGGSLACSHLVDHFEDVVGERCVQVRVCNFLDAEHVEHLVVGVSLQALELVDGDLSVVDRDEVQQLLVLVDVDVELLDGRAVRVDIFLDRALRLEEALEGGLAHGHLLELGLLVALL